MADEREGAGAEDVSLGELRVFLQLRSAVDAVPRRGETIERARVGGRQPEDDGVIVRSIDRRDVLIERLSRRQHARLWLDQALVGRPNVGRREQRPIVELHVLPELEGEGQPVGAGGPGRGDIRLDAHVLPVAGVFEQRGIVRAHGVRDPERGAGMTVVTGGLSDDGEVENATALGCLVRSLRRRTGDDREGGQARQSEHVHEPAHERFPFYPTMGCRKARGLLGASGELSWVGSLDCPAARSMIVTGIRRSHWSHRSLGVRAACAAVTGSRRVPRSGAARRACAFAVSSVRCGLPTDRPI